MKMLKYTDEAAVFYCDYYNNTEDIPRLYRRRGLFSRSVGVQSPTERKQFFELPLLVKSRALKNSSRLQSRLGVEIIFITLTSS